MVPIVGQITKGRVGYLPVEVYSPQAQLPQRKEINQKGIQKKPVVSRGRSPTRRSKPPPPPDDDDYGDDDEVVDDIVNGVLSQKVK